MAEKVIDEQLEGNLGPAVAILNLSRLIIHNPHFPVTVTVQPVYVSVNPEIGRTDAFQGR